MLLGMITALDVGLSLDFFLNMVRVFLYTLTFISELLSSPFCQICLLTFVFQFVLLPKKTRCLKIVTTLLTFLFSCIVF